MVCKMYLLCIGYSFLFPVSCSTLGRVNQRGLADPTANVAMPVIGICSWNGACDLSHHPPIPSTHLRVGQLVLHGWPHVTNGACCGHSPTDWQAKSDGVEVLERKVVRKC